MYLHIGNGKNIVKKDVIGLFDMDTATTSSATRKFIRAKEKNRQVEYGDSDIPRSFVLVREEGKSDARGSERRKEKWQRVRKTNARIHLSKISTSALRARAMSDSFEYYDVTEEI